MTLLAEGRLENLRASVDDYVATVLGPSFQEPTGTIDYQSTMPIPDSLQATLKEWLEVFLLGPARPDAGAGRYAENGDWLQRIIPIVQVNIFIRPRLQTSARRLQQLRDLVADVLYPGQAIPVTDWAGDRSALGSLRLTRISMDQAVKLPAGYEDQEQWTYSVDCRWVEHVRLD